MDREFILDFNKKCAEFLGWKRAYAHEFDKYGYCQTVDGYETPFVNIISDEQIIEYNNSRFTYSESELQFHSDWNWIMEVVEAIEKLKFNVRITKSSITIETSVGCEFDLKTIYSFHSDEYPITKKEAVVHAINNFLDGM